MHGIETLIKEMITYYRGDPKRIQHFIKVHSFAKTIGILEKLDSESMCTLEVAALVHDIGIRVCEEKYGECSGKLQEKEGPALAKDMLERLGYEERIIDRVCFLVGNHHTYDKIDKIDYQILVEADFLVNIFEDGLPKEAILQTYHTIFKTKAGKFLCKQMFDLDV